MRVIDHGLYEQLQNASWASVKELLGITVNIREYLAQMVDVIMGDEDSDLEGAIWSGLRDVYVDDNNASG